MKKKSLLVITITLFAFLMIYAQPRKGGYNNTSNRMYTDISVSYSGGDIGGEWNNYFTHQGDGKAIGYEIGGGLNGSGILSFGAGIGSSNYNRNASSGISSSDHYLHVGFLIGFDAWRNNSNEVIKGVMQQKSGWSVKPAGTIILTYLSKIDDDDETKSGSIEFQSYLHYSKDIGLTGKVEASYHLNDWFCPGVTYSSIEGIIPELGFDVTNSFKVKIGYGLNKQVSTSLIFSEFF